MAISKTRNLLFSCSNDKNINIWKINQAEITSNSSNTEIETNSSTTNNTTNISPLTITPSYSINQYHKDYIKCLCFKDNSHNNLYACSYDGTITMHRIDEYSATGAIKPKQENIIYKSGNGNSIYSIDCDNTGNVLLASIYENVIYIFKYTINNININILSIIYLLKYNTYLFSKF